MRIRRKIIEIDEALCDGCGDCVNACEESALRLVDGKAKLVGENSCDGLGACVGECPRGAITIVEREAEGAPRDPSTDASRGGAAPHRPPLISGGCPGSALRSFAAPASSPARVEGDQPPASQLGHWPVQLMLVPPHAPFLVGADLLVCADCVPFAVSDFHARYLRGRAVVVGCPKLDDLSHYAEKLRLICDRARPSRVTVARMQVPCCRGIADVTAAAAAEFGIAVEEHVIGVQGGIVSRAALRPVSVPAAPSSGPAGTCPR